MDTHTVVAIDGPAASGKSAVARALARKLAFVYVNSGAMYRAVTWYALQKGISTADSHAVIALLRGLKIECGLANNESNISINGQNPEQFLNDEAVNRNVSNIASVAEVRDILVAKQREYAQHSDLVMEGRDIGTVVFSCTPYKFYIDASIEVRAMRRAKQGLRDEISARDKQDSSRRASPLTIAEDSHVIDSSNLTIDGVVGEIIGRLKLKGLKINY
ncbi:MAG: (d)CMP kinase [Chthoniobacteraceae bacterium]